MLRKLVRLGPALLRKFGGAGALVALGRLTFMLFVVIAGRNVDSTQFGLFMVGLISSQILALICTLGTGASSQVIVTDAVARNRPALAIGFVRFSLAITVTVSLAVAGLLIAVSLVLQRLAITKGETDVLIPIALLLFPMALSTLREFLARALGSSVLAFGPRDVVWTLVMTGLLLVLPATVGTNLTAWAALMLLLVEGLAWFVIWIRYLRQMKARRRNVSAYYDRWLRHSVAMLFNFIVGFSFERIDTFAVSGFTSLAVAGAYAAASRVAMIVAISQRFVIPIVLPNIVAALGRRDLAGARSEIRHGMLISLLMALPIYLVFMVLAEPIMGIFGESFRSYGNILRLLATAQLGLAINGPLAAALTGGGSPLIYARFGWIALTLTAVLLVGLTPWLGAAGAAIGVMLGIGLQLAFVFGAVNKRFALVHFGSRDKSSEG